MPNIDDTAKQWQEDQSSRIGAAVRQLRKMRGMTAVDLADRTRELGFPVTRVAITKIENNSRAGKFDVAELIVLAAALGVPPILLLYPDYPYGWVEVVPAPDDSGRAGQMPAARWFAGEQLLHKIADYNDEFASTAVELMRTTREQHVVQSVMIYGSIELQESPLSEASDSKRAMVKAATEQNEELGRKAALLWERLHGTAPPKSRAGGAEDA